MRRCLNLTYYYDRNSSLLRKPVSITCQGIFPITVTQPYLFMTVFWRYFRHFFSCHLCEFTVSDVVCVRARVPSDHGAGRRQETRPSEKIWYCIPPVMRKALWLLCADKSMSRRLIVQTRDLTPCLLFKVRTNLKVLPTHFVCYKIHNLVTLQQDNQAHLLLCVLFWASSSVSFWAAVAVSALVHQAAITWFNCHKLTYYILLAVNWLPWMNYCLMATV